MWGFFLSNTIDVGELFGCFFGTHRKAGAQSADERLHGGGGGGGAEPSHCEEWVWVGMGGQQRGSGGGSRVGGGPEGGGRAAL